MLKKRIQAVRPFTLHTRVDDRTFNENEVAIVKFENERQYKELLGFGNFKEAYNTIPVVRRPPNRPKVEVPVQAEKEEIEEESKTEGKEEKDVKSATSKGKDKATKSTASEVKQACPNCGTDMVVIGEENVPGKPIRVTMSCPICSNPEIVEKDHKVTK